jgi:hypothetical protein
MTEINRHNQLLPLSTFLHSGARLYARWIISGALHNVILDNQSFTATLQSQIPNAGGHGEIIFAHTVHDDRAPFSLGRVTKIEGDVGPKPFGSCSADGIVTA